MRCRRAQWSAIIRDSGAPRKSCDYRRIPASMGTPLRRPLPRRSEYPGISVIDRCRCCTISWGGEESLATRGQVWKRRWQSGGKSITLACLITWYQAELRNSLLPGADRHAVWKSKNGEKLSLLHREPDVVPIKHLHPETAYTGLVSSWAQAYNWGNCWGIRPWPLPKQPTPLLGLLSEIQPGDARW